MIRSLSVILLALAALACGGEPAATAPEPIEGAALAARIAAGEPPLILDVRTEAEFEAGHIPGAINIPHDALAGRLGELPGAPDTEIVVHCQSGKRAGMAEETLAEAGYTNVRDLTGHWQAWQDAELPRE